MYRAAQERNQTQALFASLDDYLKALDLMVRVEWGEAISVARAAQLTQKTNQFNLTTRRYTESDLTRMLVEGDFAITTFAVSDRYGDYGITGLAIIRIEARREVAYLDTFLMSCRVIGRNVERAFFDYLVGKLRKIDIRKLQAEYFKTLKNDQVAGFYDSLGFYRKFSEAGSREYELVLGDYQQSGIDYIQVRENDN